MSTKGKPPLRIDLDGDDFGYMNGMIGNMTVMGCAGAPALLNGWNWMALGISMKLGAVVISYILQNIFSEPRNPI